jgi:sulfur transfer protein SufE
MTIDDIRDNFALLDDWDDRYRYVIELGRTPQQILATDAVAVFDEFGFREHLTPQRSNGLRSMIERIRTDAREALATTS